MKYNIRKPLKKGISVMLILVFLLGMQEIYIHIVLAARVQNVTILNPDKSSNPKAVKVSQNGKVTFIKRGTAKITAQAQDGSKKKAVCSVTVKGAGASDTQTEPKYGNLKLCRTDHDKKNLHRTECSCVMPMEILYS